MRCWGGKMKNGQQEMIGFVLIVVLVVVAIFVFMFISLKKENKIEDSLEVGNLLGGVLGYTTECYVSFEPDYDLVRELIDSCYKNRDCKNFGPACEYLNKSLTEIVKSVMKTETGFSAYNLKIGEKDGQDIFNLVDGVCRGGIVGTSEKMRIGSAQVVVSLDVCY